MGAISMFLLLPDLPMVAHDEDAPDSAEGAGLGLFGAVLGTKGVEFGCICEIDLALIGGAGDATGSGKIRFGKSSLRKT